MSRRRGMRDVAYTSEAPTCGCGVVTRDDAYVCPDCLTQLAADLHDLLPTAERRSVSVVRPAGLCEWPRRMDEAPGLWGSLGDVIAGQRGIDYRTLGGATGGGQATGLVLNEFATRAGDRLRAVLRALVVECMAGHVTHTAPTGWAPTASTEVPAMAEWLLWRVDGLAWHPDTAGYPHQIRAAVARVEMAVLGPEKVQLLGPCTGPLDCDGVMGAESGAMFASCSTCNHTTYAQPLRDALIADMGWWWVTAADAGHLSTFLGLTATRQTVKNRIYQWHHRGALNAVADRPLVEHEPEPTGPRFLFSDIYVRLLTQEQRALVRPTTDHRQDAESVMR